MKRKTLWDRKTCASAGVSMILAGAVAVGVTALRGESVAVGPQIPVNVLQSHTATSMAASDVSVESEGA